MSIVERAQSSARVPTDDGPLDWVELWVGDAQPRVLAFLRRRLDHHTAEDVVQEVALQLVRRTEDFASLGHFQRWCSTVATNRIISEGRRNRLVLASVLPDLPDSVDVGSTVVARAELERVLLEIATLSPEDQDLVLDLTPTAEGRTAQTRQNVRRHRLRLRLAKTIAGIAAALGLRRNTKVLLPVLLGVSFVLAAPLVFEREHDGGPATPPPAAIGPSSSPAEASPIVATTPISSVVVSASPAVGASAASRPAASSGPSASGGDDVRRIYVVPEIKPTQVGSIGVQTTDPDDVPRDENGNLPAYCSHNSPITGDFCIYYPFTLHPSIDTEDPGKSHL